MKLTLDSAFRKAIELHQKNNLKEASVLYNEILKVQPNHMGVLFNYANILNFTGNFVKAKEYYEKFIVVNPINEDIIFKLCIIYFKLGDHLNSLRYFNRLIKINPNYNYLRYNLANVLRSNCINDLKKENEQWIKNLFLFLFRNDDIEHAAITKNVLFFIYEKNKLKSVFGEENLLSNRIVNQLIQEELFQLVLQKSNIIENFLEKILTKIRKEILLIYHSLNDTKFHKYQDFIISLSEQCWLNEYIWSESKKEIDDVKLLKNIIESKNEINEIEIAILACYLPLNSSNIIKDKLLNYKSKNPLFNDLIKLQIKQPNKELELRKEIKSLDKENNSVSIKVRDQYEENPYPRWRYCNILNSINFKDEFNFQIRPNTLDNINNLDNLNILLAGCGTGKHLININRYKNTKILAIDLSLSSLAYAKRKSDELGFKNTDFLRADILELNILDKKFDIIESAGTLHHMEDPIKGLKILLKLLNPNGLLRLGLYSQIARRDIVKVRELIKTKNFKDNPEGIKLCREMILKEDKNSLLYKTIFNRDFYSMSNIRDLLFHVQEHHFTIPQISKMIKDLDLEFLGFVFSNDSIKHEYSKIFPEDIKIINLDNWNEFELKFPNTFLSMYQFWIRKK